MTNNTKVCKGMKRSARRNGKIFINLQKSSKCSKVCKIMTMNANVFMIIQNYANICKGIQNYEQLSKVGQFKNTKTLIMTKLENLHWGKTQKNQIVKKSKKN